LQPNIVAIIITGYAQEMADLIQQTLDETAQTCLTKPMDMAQLLGILAKLFAAKRQESSVNQEVKINGQQDGAHRR
jgi:DNA-binding NtrC family response regulator